MPANPLDAVMGGKGRISIVQQLAGTVDPGPNQDVTQGFSVGSIWFNATPGQLRWWECYGAAQGSGTWIFGGADYLNGGTNPPSEVTQFGLGAALMAEEGNINRQISSAGVNPGGTGGDYVLAVYSLPANSFDSLGRGITVTAQGSLANNGNTKRIKIIFNPTTATVGGSIGTGIVIADTGAITVGGSGWSIQANVFKYGTLGSNNQIALHQQSQVGNLVSPLLNPTLMSAVESGPILIAITGNPTSTATDIAFNFLEINACN